MLDDPPYLKSFDLLDFQIEQSISFPNQATNKIAYLGTCKHCKGVERRQNETPSHVPNESTTDKNVTCK